MPMLVQPLNKHWHRWMWWIRLLHGWQRLYPGKACV